MRIWSSNSVNDRTNTYYTNYHNVTNLDEFREATSHDFVCATYEHNKRANNNFIASDCMPFDLDNDHTDDANAWATPQNVASVFPDVEFYVQYSKSHNKQKGEHGTPRPRFHVIFPIEPIKDLATYKALKDYVYNYYPVVDDNALDGARYLNGTPEGKVEHFKGSKNLTQFIEEMKKFEELPDSNNITISEGSRNTTLHRIACVLLKKYGEEKARELYIDKYVPRCDPPLPDTEIETIWRQANKFYVATICKDPAYIAPASYNSSHKPRDYSDSGEAERFVQEYSNCIKSTQGTGFLVYTGTHWKEDSSLATVKGLEFTQLQLTEVSNQIAKEKEKLISLGIDETIANVGGRGLEKACADKNYDLTRYKDLSAYYKFVTKMRDGSHTFTFLKMAKDKLNIDVNKLDCNPYLLNTPSGVINLITGEVQPHKTDDLLTKITSCGLSANGDEMWELALDTFFQSDKDLIRYVKRIVGMAAIGKILQEQMIIAFGGGANGKSTFWNAIATVLGTYSGTISAETLTQNYKQNYKAEIAELKGKRLVIASELEEGTRLNTAMVKKLCSTDRIQAEKKYQAPFSFVPSHTLVLYTNHLPRVGACDVGTWRRLIVIPFNANLSGCKEVKNYADHLVEVAGGAILQWICEGATEAIENGYKLVVPQAVEEAIGKYKSDNDWFGHFIFDCCDVGEYEEKSGELYKAYRSYCNEYGEYTRSTTDFYRALEEHAFSRKKTKKGVFVKGLKLKKATEFL